MGRTSLEGMLEMTSQVVALQWHLQSNHYSPISDVFIPTAEKAIELANKGDWFADIEMPNGITKTAGAIVEELHLESFIVSDWMGI